jgi:hypothetical protein
MSMAHFVFGFLHELNNFDALSGDDAEAYAEWLAKWVKRRCHQKLDLSNPLMVISRPGKTISFPPADDFDIGFLRFLNTITESPGDSWAAAILAATIMIAEEMGLYGAGHAISEPNEANTRLRSTPQDLIIRDISHEVPAQISAAYQSCMDRSCAGRLTSEDESRDWCRKDLAALYECFLRSYLPPFTSNMFGWYQFYRCLDLREAALRGECKQGDGSSPYGEVAITFAHVNE